jgi:predicted nucleic acid-binding protein
MLAIIKFDCFSRPEDILALAKTFKITAYDAEFVSLAIERDTQLVTIDKALLNTFPDICKKPIQ